MNVSICVFTDCDGDISHTVAPSNIVKFACNEFAQAYSTKPEAGKSSKFSLFGSSKPKETNLKIKTPEVLTNELAELFKLFRSCEAKYKSDLNYYIGYDSCDPKILKAIKNGDINFIVSYIANGVDVTGMPADEYMVNIIQFLPEFEKQRDLVKWCIDNKLKLDSEEYYFNQY